MHKRYLTLFSCFLLITCLLLAANKKRGWGGVKEAIRAAIVEALESTPRYAHITAEAELQNLFQRHGDQHSVRHAYHDHEVANAELTVYVSIACSILRSCVGSA